MTVHFVGSGPGAADLLTLRAVDLLRAAPVVLYAGTYLDAEILEHCKGDAELIDTQHLDLDQITAHLVDADRRGLDAVRLCSGDPSLYSALTEQTRRLDAEGVAWDVTPGVPAYAAAAATLGTELTVPELVQTVVLTRTQARSTSMPDTEALARVAGLEASLVLHLAITRIRVLAAELSETYGSDCPAAVVAFASRPNQIVLRGTLADIAEKVEVAGLKHTAVIIVGRALGVRDTPDVACSHLYDPARDRSI
ncbi:cobalt-precorrin-4/precorrin-4 C(11)-methyltransferase [Rhodococcus artemisiae]|uniref:SAM-dependent methyltransferase n=1 Tax=Rhodococcus artemisiae TaxID=714159 RepID=A0ABU7LHH7_9NOCA|nr:SAM-dependent methyltransferase [Rhodococcus artemisiae]MEE2061009.1 SAM-dependent methyltransferase [Rhodococcus artemisiae]